MVTGSSASASDIRSTPLQPKLQLPPTILGAIKKVTLLIKRASRKLPATFPPPSTSTLCIERRPSSSKTEHRFDGSKEKISTPLFVKSVFPDLPKTSTGASAVVVASFDLGERRRWSSKTTRTSGR